MSIISNLSVFIIIILTLSQIFKVFSAATITDDTTTDDTNFTFLITGGYRPQKHVLTKYLVSIRTRFYREYFGDNHFCGGSIIGPRIILSAAHCLAESYTANPKNPRTIRVVAKIINRLVMTDDTLVYDVRTVRIHPLYDPKAISNDIAIAKLEDDIDLDGSLAAIIPLVGKALDPGTQCTVIGWGRILMNGPLAADVIYVDLNIQADEECKSYSTLYKDGMLCVSDLKDPELDACQGDSGGPLIVNSELVGVVSYGKGCSSGVPGVYTDVYYYRDWIKENRSCRLAGNRFFFTFFIIMGIVMQ